MSIKKSERVAYQRHKDKVEIRGEATQVKWMIWIDLVSYPLYQTMPILILAWLSPKLAVALIVLKWLKTR